MSRNSGIGLCAVGGLAGVRARSTGEPWEPREIVSDAAENVQEVTFPTVAPRVMMAERTFWEKATAIHVFCLQERFSRAERSARHWHDVVRLDEAGYAASAFANRDLAGAAARRKAAFFTEKDAADNIIDHQAAVSGGLRLAPEQDVCATLAEDYRRMVEDGLLFDEAEPFEVLLQRCRDIEQRANLVRVAFKPEASAEGGTAWERVLVKHGLANCKTPVPFRFVLRLSL
jgi:hypothetical protein